MAKSKKSFILDKDSIKRKAVGLSLLIPDSEAPAKKTGRGRPKRSDKDNAAAPAAERGTQPGEMRKTYLVNIEQAEKLEALAYWERITVKEAMANALSSYLKSYEAQKGPIKPIKK